ncbi:hypothetical protein MDA_GLEAN10006749 [Myotis davidii]|uniref:Uncharacterized protein n=1 Tax=Myotis davidii TaxID=225400 RepID=L5LJL9_MYODS|nr:hypothetical protein MDA_GLEAN10006749 [Myotis davidii]
MSDLPKTCMIPGWAPSFLLPKSAVANLSDLMDHRLATADPDELARANELLAKYFLMLTKWFVYSYVQEVTPPSAEVLPVKDARGIFSPVESPFSDLTTKRVHQGHLVKQEHVSLSSRL